MDDFNHLSNEEILADDTIDWNSLSTERKREIEKHVVHKLVQECRDRGDSLEEINDIIQSHDEDVRQLELLDRAHEILASLRRQGLTEAEIDLAIEAFQRQIADPEFRKYKQAEHIQYRQRGIHAVENPPQ